MTKSNQSESILYWLYNAAQSFGTSVHELLQQNCFSLHASQKECRSSLKQLYAANKVNCR